MLLTTPAPALVHRTLADRAVDRVARLLVDAGTRLQDGRTARSEHRADHTGARRTLARRRHELGDRIRDNTAQINPLGLR